MYPAQLKAIASPTVRARVAIERRIVRSLVSELIDNGFILRVDDGEELHKPTVSVSIALDQLMNTDQDMLNVFMPQGENMPRKYVGNVSLVYGNDGWDVIADYHTALEKHIPRTLALIEALS